MRAPLKATPIGLCGVYYIYTGAKAVRIIGLNAFVSADRLYTDYFVWQAEG